MSSQVLAYTLEKNNQNAYLKKIDWIPNAHLINKIDFGNNFTCILYDDGKILTNGSNKYCQLGIFDDLNFSHNYNFKNISCSSYSTFALNSRGKLYHWGKLICDELECFKRVLKKDPIMMEIDSVSPVVDIACGDSHALALTQEGEVFVIGSNLQKQCGNHFNEYLHYFERLKELNGAGIKAIFAGGNVSCVITSFGEINVWGSSRVYKKIDPSFIVFGKFFSLTILKNNSYMCFENISQDISTVSFKKLHGIDITDIAIGNYFTVKLNKSEVLYCDNIFLSEKFERIFRCNSNFERPLAVYSKFDNCIVLVSSKTDDINNQQIYLKYQGDKYRKVGSSFFKSSDLEILSGAIKNKEKKNEILSIIGSVSCLSSSFIDSSDLKSNFQINLDEVRLANQFFEKIFYSSSDRYNLYEAFTSASFQLPRCNPSYALNACFFLLECPILSDIYTDDFDIVINFSINLFLWILNLEEKWLNVFSSFYRANHPRFIMGIVNNAKTILIECLKFASKGSVKETQFSKQTILTCLVSYAKIIGLMHKINLSAQQKYYLPDESFEIVNLSKYVDLKHDFDQFSIDKSQIISSNPDKQGFNFIAYPFLIPMQDKINILNYDVSLQMRSAIAHSYANDPLSFGRDIIPHLLLKVKRTDLMNSSFHELGTLNEIDLKKPLVVKFIGEDAEDDGGVKREFFYLIVEKIFNKSKLLFRYFPESGLFWFNHSAFEINDYWLVGIVFGLAIYNGVIMNIPLPKVFYKKILGHALTFHDLSELMPSVYKSLIELLEYSNDDIEDTFLIDFTLNDNYLGKTKHVELIPDGKNIFVNQQNKTVYIEKVANYYLDKSIETVFDKFMEGFLKVTSRNVIMLFGSEQLQKLLIGCPVTDLSVLQINCKYVDGYYPNHQVIKWFWDFVLNFDENYKRKFLKFLTGSPRLPFDPSGIQMMIRRTLGGDNFLPVAHTCVNMLDLPDYRSADVLYKKIIISIEEGEGFTLV